MSEVQHTATSAVDSTEPTTTASTAATTEQPQTSALESAAAPALEEPKVETNGVATETAAPSAAAAATLPAEEKPTEALPAAEKPVEKAAEKAVEPITEGQLNYKGPGLVKSIIPSKKEFWLSDLPVTPQHMDLYMRGEKPEISNAVVAWASQTGKGLLFFNKKSDTDRKHPQSVLPLYDATELKKAHPHEITFELHGHKHTLKAANDAERDGWFLSLERAMEMGKADKEAVREGEGYKAEMEKLNKPNVMGAGVGRAQPATKTPATDAADESKPHGVAAGAAKINGDTHKKNQKSRSTSRGILGRLQGKKDEMEAKQEEKKEEKAAEKEEKKADKQELKHDHKAEDVAEAAPLAAAGVAGGAALDARGTADRAVGAPVETAQEPAESGPVTSAATHVTPKADEKVNKGGKRGSIFGRMGSGFGSLKSPTKEKDLKDVEAKPEVPPKDTGVSETAPQIPEPSTEATDAAAAAPAAVDAAAPEVTEPKSEGKPAEAAKEQLDAIAPANTGKNSFLSGLPFMNKRNRSVSPSTPMKESPKVDEAPAVPPKEEAVEPTATEETPKIAEPVTEPTATEPVTETAAPVTEAADKPMEKAEEPMATTATDAATPASNKRQSSIFGNLGRRASKAFKGIQSPARKENAAPAATDATKVEDKVEPTAADKPLVNGETKAPETTEQQQPQSIGDVVPDAVSTGQPQTAPTVTASA